MLQTSLLLKFRVLDAGLPPRWNVGLTALSTSTSASRAFRGAAAIGSGFDMCGKKLLHAIVPLLFAAGLVLKLRLPVSARDRASASADSSHTA
jgi:hypothetical protein